MCSQFFFFFFFDLRCKFQLKINKQYTFGVSFSYEPLPDNATNAALMYLGLCIKDVRYFYFQV